MNLDDSWVSLHAALRRVHMQLAKATPEALELGHIELLVAKENDLMVKQCFVDLLIGFLVKWARKIDAPYLCSNNRRQRLN